MMINLDIGAGLLKAILAVVVYLIVRSWFSFKTGGRKIL